MLWTFSSSIKCQCSQFHELELAFVSLMDIYPKFLEMLLSSQRFLINRVKKTVQHFSAIKCNAEVATKKNTSFICQFVRSRNDQGDQQLLYLLCVVDPVMSPSLSSGQGPTEARVQSLRIISLSLSALNSASFTRRGQHSEIELPIAELMYSFPLLEMPYVL